MSLFYCQTCMANYSEEFGPYFIGATISEGIIVENKMKYKNKIYFQMCVCVFCKEKTISSFTEISSRDKLSRVNTTWVSIAKVPAIDAVILQSILLIQLRIILVLSFLLVEILFVFQMLLNQLLLWIKPIKGFSDWSTLEQKREKRLSYRY